MTIQYWSTKLPLSKSRQFVGINILFIRMKWMSTADILAYVTCIGYCVSTVVLSETTQVTVGKFHYPFILRYINTIQQIAFLPCIPIWKYVRSKQLKSTNIIMLPRKNNNTYIWFIYYAFLSAIITSISGILINESLQHVTIPTSSTISGMRPISVLILSILLINEKLTLWKISAMMVALIGVLLFVLELKHRHTIIHGETHDTFLGIMLTILWTIGFSLNDIITKKLAIYCLETDKYIIGSILYIVTSSIAVLFLFCWTLIYPQPIELDAITMDQIKWVLLNGIIIFILHLCIRICVALKSPFFIAVGNGLAIPLAFIVDVFVHDYKPNIYAICGALFIIVSFLMLELVKPTDKYKSKICKMLLFCDIVLLNKDKKDKEKENDKMEDKLLNDQSFVSVNNTGMVIDEQSVDFRVSDSLNIPHRDQI